ncbi:MOSC domain-containing protein [Candidatus Saccharibacteria bacterium]|nr:MOSC domain-containing protein [Candidatus Saccharibacteria bacterium]
MTRPYRIQVVSVGVGKSQVIGAKPSGEEWSSAIHKEPVSSRSLWVDRNGLEGDTQVDRRVHGGDDKAVYAYPSEHLKAWAEEVGREITAAELGVNLLVEGVTEETARIDDKWWWNGVRLIITKPRQPCNTLRHHTGIQDIRLRMKNNGFCGWYLRVLQPGRGLTSGDISVTPGYGPTVAEVFAGKTFET